MGDSGAAPQQRPSERYWFFPPASRRPWLTTRSPLRRIRQHKDPWPQAPRHLDCPRPPARALPNRTVPRGTVDPDVRGMAARGPTNLLPALRPPVPRARRGQFFRCLVPCFRPSMLPRRRGPRPLPRPLRRPPGRHWHLAREPQPPLLRAAPRPRTGQSLPLRPGPPRPQPLPPPALRRRQARRRRPASPPPVGWQ